MEEIFSWPMSQPALQGREKRLNHSNLTKTSMAASFTLTLSPGLWVMLHSHEFRQTIDGKPDATEVDESRVVKSDEAGRECCQR